MLSSTETRKGLFIGLSVYVIRSLANMHHCRHASCVVHFMQSYNTEADYLVHIDTLLYHSFVYELDSLLSSK